MAYVLPLTRRFAINLISIALLTAFGTGPGIGAENINLTVLTGDAGGSETVLASDMAGLFAESGDLRVQPQAGDAGLVNIQRLLDDPHVDLAFATTDALDATESETRSGRLELVLRLGPQEIHVLARKEIGSLAGLAGKSVNFGPAGSGAAIAAARLFDALKIAVKPAALDGAGSIEALKQGKIAAVVIVGAKPVPLLAKIEASRGFHLLPIAFDRPLQTLYLPTSLSHADYPNLIGERTPVPTVATGLALLAAKGNANAAPRVAACVDTLFTRFAALKRPGKHPKWRDINLAASLPGVTRTPSAEAWLTAHKPAVADANLAGEEKEALFKAYVEWQRANGH